ETDDGPNSSRRPTPRQPVPSPARRAERGLEHPSVVEHPGRGTGAPGDRPEDREAVGSRAALGPSVRGLRLHIHPRVGAVVDPVVLPTEPEETTTVTPSDIIYQRRVRVLDHARRTGNV